VVRVVIVKEDDGSWRAYLCTDSQASVEAIVQATVDRWGIEQNFHDLKEVEGIEQGAVALLSAQATGRRRPVPTAGASGRGRDQ
jgi:hypothetical protein